MAKLNSIYITKTDEEVIDIYRNNAHYRTKQEIETYFYKKYSPLFKTLSRKFYYAESVEDNMQECYLKMIEILEDSSYTVGEDTLGLMLRKKINSHLQYQGKKAQEYMVEEYIELDEEDEDAIITKQSKIHSEEFVSELIFNITLKDFRKQLSTYENKLMDLLPSSMEKKEIAKELGYKHTANLAPIRKSLKERYITFMNEAGYELAI